MSFISVTCLYAAGHPLQSQTRSLNLNKVFSSVFISYYIGRFGQWQVTDPVVQRKSGEPRHCNWDWVRDAGDAEGELPGGVRDVLVPGDVVEGVDVRGPAQQPLPQHEEEHRGQPRPAPQRPGHSLEPQHQRRGRLDRK